MSQIVKQLTIFSKIPPLARIQHYTLCTLKRNWPECRRVGQSSILQVENCKKNKIHTFSRLSGTSLKLPSSVVPPSCTGRDVFPSFIGNELFPSKTKNSISLA